MSYRFAAPKALVGSCLVGAILVALVFMGANASAAPAPIRVGAIVTEGASVGFPTSASKTLTRYFRDYNARGGFKGRRIQVNVVNDALNSEKNVAGTKQLIDQGVVALLGSQAVLNCLGNSSLIQQANLYSLGFGPQATCFNLKQWGQTGPGVSAQVALNAQYAKQRFGSKVCLIGINLPGGDPLWERAELMLSRLGTKFTYKNTSVSPTTDPTAALLSAQRAGCRSVVVTLSPPQTVQAANAKVTQRIRNMELILANGYDNKTLRGIGKNAEGSYFFSYLYPFTQNDSRTRAYRRFTNKHKITPEFFGEQAYLSAELFVKALETIRGSVTRQSVGAAIAKLNTTHPLVPGRRFRFGGPGNATIFGGYMIRVKNGKFTLAPNGEVSLPARVRSLAGKL